MTDSTLSPLTTSDGENLAVVDWPVAPHLLPRAVVIIVHGLGEHIWRYDHVARALNSWGYTVRGYDQYGHGESAGTRGTLPSATRLLDDLADVVDDTRIRLQADGMDDLPLVLLGHSMGGLVAARFVSLGLRPVDALVLSSPALDAGLNPLQKLLVAALLRVAPNLTLSNGLDATKLSHDPVVVKAYLNDPLVHNRISARLAHFIATAGPATLAAVPKWTVPTLLMYAGRDHLVRPAGARAFAQAAPDCVESYCYEQLYHEIFNELKHDVVLQRLEAWLSQRFGRDMRRAPLPAV